MHGNLPRRLTDAHLAMSGSHARAGLAPPFVSRRVFVADGAGVAAVVRLRKRSPQESALTSWLLRSTTGSLVQARALLPSRLLSSGSRLAPQPISRRPRECGAAPAGVSAVAAVGRVPTRQYARICRSHRLGAEKAVERSQSGWPGVRGPAFKCDADRTIPDMRRCGAIGGVRNPVAPLRAVVLDRVDPPAPESGYPRSRRQRGASSSKSSNASGGRPWVGCSRARSSASISRSSRIA